MANTVKVLVIDDSEDDRMLYRRTLQKSVGVHYVVVEAENGEEGLSRISAEEPACVLLDYSLPGHNGIEVLKRIRELHAFMPVVMLTGQGNENVAVSAMQEGAQNYISKSAITAESLQRVTLAAVDYCALHRRIFDQRTSLEIFSRALAHDLKEPVRMIRSFLGLLAPHQGFSEKEKTYFNYIEKAATRMSALIDTVFFYMRFEGNGKEIAKENYDVTGVVEEVKENLSELIRERGAVITAGSFPRVLANRTQLMQLVQNLISNAIQHSEGTPRIDIRAEKHGSVWEFSVSDNGPGIAPEDCERIFEPFKRLAGATEPGMGMGLAICRKIVESHGGKIWCVPGEGGGASFRFTLPEAPGTPAAASEHSPGAATAAKAPAAANGKALANLLLVEDNKADVELARIMLMEEAGLQFTFLVARDAYEALTMMPRGKDSGAGIDLMLLDVNMPGMSGFDLLKRMQADGSLRHIPVVMCSTSSDVRDMEMAKSLGAQGYMVKPPGMDKLKPLIDKISTLRLRKEGEKYVLCRTA